MRLRQSRELPPLGGVLTEYRREITAVSGQIAFVLDLDDLAEESVINQRAGAFLDC